MSAAIVGVLQDKIRVHAVDVVRTAGPLMTEMIRGAESRRTGAMADATTVTEPSLTSDRVTCEARVDVEYATWQEEGTGIYGPVGARIFPTRAKVLVFDWPAAGGTVFARSIAGAPGRHFFYDQNPERWYDSLAASLGGQL